LLKTQDKYASSFFSKVHCKKSSGSSAVQTHSHEQSVVEETRSRTGGSSYKNGEKVTEINTNNNNNNNIIINNNLKARPWHVPTQNSVMF
jgi:hypothetical protein